MAKSPKQSEKHYKKLGADLKHLGLTDLNLRHLTPQKKAAITRAANKHSEEIRTLRWIRENPERVQSVYTTPERAKQFEASGFQILRKAGKRVEVLIRKGEGDKVKIRRSSVTVDRVIESPGGGRSLFRERTKLIKNRAELIDEANRVLDQLDKYPDGFKKLGVRIGGYEWKTTFADRRMFEQYLKVWRPQRTTATKESLIEQMVLFEIMGIDDDDFEGDEDDKPARRKKRKARRRS